MAAPWPDEIVGGMETVIMDTRLGKQHPTLRRVRDLRRDPRLRREQGVFVAEGLHLAEEALASRASIELVLYSERLTEHDAGRALLDRIVAADLERAEVADTVLAALQDARSPQPVLTLARRRDTTLEACLSAVGPHPLFVVAHGIQDPGNLGGLWRTADAAGAAALFVTGESADPYHPRTVRATMGSVFRLAAVATDVEAATAAFRRAGLTTLATTPSASTDYHAATFTSGCAVYFGGEGAGLPGPVLAAMDACVRIPMRGGVESLSVGAAAAVVLFEAAHQRARA